MNHYPHHIGDFNNATRHLSRVERSIYSDLLDVYYDTEQALTGDLKKLARRIVAVSADEIEAMQAVLDEFFVLEDGEYHNKRCDQEIAAYREKSEKAASNAKARWNKGSKPNAVQTDSEGNANAMRTHSEGNANAMRTHSEGNANQNQNQNQYNPPNPPCQGGDDAGQAEAKQDDDQRPSQPPLPTPATEQGQEPETGIEPEPTLDDLLETIWIKPDSNRTMFQMPPNWTCQPEELENYLKLMGAKALLGGKRVTASQITPDILADFIRLKVADGRRQRHDQWVNKLASYLVAILTKRYQQHGPGIRPEDNPDFDYPLWSGREKSANVTPPEIASQNARNLIQFLRRGAA